MKIPIIKGIYTNDESDFRESFPVNYEPVAVDTGISKGYLRPADGIIKLSSGGGIDRGGINWNGTHYRVMGNDLIIVSESGSITSIGSVGGYKQVSFSYSFDRLAIASNNNLFYYDGTTLSQVTDPDLGNVVDQVWIDGYFMTTDGEYLIVTELNDPTQVSPVKYGSSELDPDPIVAIKKLRNEAYAINRYTIEPFNNVGGAGFPFQVVKGAQVQRGCVGTHACTVFVDNIAFLGGGSNESVSVWLAVNGQSVKLATREVDLILVNYKESVLSDVIVEERVTSGQQLLYIHLPDVTLVYNAYVSKIVGSPIWYKLSSGIDGKGIYKARNFVRCYDMWLCADPSSENLGYLVENESGHYGNKIGWSFSTPIIYNDGRGAIFHQLELVTLSGRAKLGDNPTISTQYTTDGETWSNPRFINAGKTGERNKRLVWFQQGMMADWRVQRFTGTSDAHLAISSLEANVEPLNA